MTTEHSANKHAEDKHEADKHSTDHLEKSESNNTFLTGTMGAVFVKTALPIIIMMMVNGSFSLVDAFFLGEFVGANALTAVTSVFPVFMLMVALSSLVSNGFSSVVARLIGAKKLTTARQAYAQALTLSLVVCLLLILAYLLGGEALVLFVNNGSAPLAQMSSAYLLPTILFSPLMFILSINSDSLRCEGKMSFVAMVSLLSVLLNGVLNYLFIAQFHWGIVGSAYGSIGAQALSLLVIFYYRNRHRTILSVPVITLTTHTKHWREFLALGVPSSLMFIGLSLSATAILYNLQVWNSENYQATVAAYGIITRLMTFIFLPLLGLSMAFQTILGNNVGAQQWLRANSAIKIALLASLIYCVVLQGVILLIKDQFGSWFVDDLAIQHEVARILPTMSMALFLLGPLMIVNKFFQAIGDAKRAGILGISKTYVFGLPLIFILPLYFAEIGIWYAGPSAEFLALLLTVIILYRRYQQNGNRFGLLYQS